MSVLFWRFQYLDMHLKAGRNKQASKMLSHLASFLIGLFFII
jgi:hypothetical protein